MEQREYNKICKEILSIIHKETGKDFEYLDDKCDLERDLCLDSLEMVSLQIAIEDWFGVEFDPLYDDFDQCFSTFGNLCAYVAGKAEKEK